MKINQDFAIRPYLVLQEIHPTAAQIEITLGKKKQLKMASYVNFWQVPDGLFPNQARGILNLRWETTAIWTIAGEDSGSLLLYRSKN